MIAQEKRGLVGDETALSAWERRCRDVLSLLSEPPKQQFSGSVIWLEDETRLPGLRNLWSHYTALVERGEYSDTPIGIGLERWFEIPLVLERAPASCANRSGTERVADEVKPRICPLFCETADNFWRGQCLGCAQLENMF